MKKLILLFVGVSFALTVITACGSSSSCAECTITVLGQTATTKYCKKDDKTVTVTAGGASQDISTGTITADAYIDNTKKSVTALGGSCK